LIGYEVAADQLRNGVDVVAESVNPLPASRDAGRDAGLDAGARVLEVEVVCSDATEHRRRAEERVLDVPGLARATWSRSATASTTPGGGTALLWTRRYSTSTSQCSWFAKASEAERPVERTMLVHGRGSNGSSRHVGDLLVARSAADPPVCLLSLQSTEDPQVVRHAAVSAVTCSG
jgi:hypothetical protein